MTAAIQSVQTGRTAPLGPDHVPSGFVKTARSGDVAVTMLGLEDDQQADLNAHGGPEKAVYGYAASRYPIWQQQFPAIAFTGGPTNSILQLRHTSAKWAFSARKPYPG